MTANADGLRQRLLERYAEVGADAATQLQSALQSAAPLGETGETRRRTSVVVEAGPTPAAPVVTLRADVGTEYASYVEEGTPPHVILPVNASVLRFVVPGVGVVFARVVNHPGTTATRWFATTLRDEFGPAFERAASRS